MKKYLRNNSILAESLQDLLVMLDIDKGKYYSLNSVATRIWELIDQPKTIENICEVLTNEFEVDFEQCKKEVEDHLAQMYKLGLLETKGLE